VAHRCIIEARIGTHTGEQQGPEQSPRVGHASKAISLNGIANEETLARRTDKPCVRELVISNENHLLRELVTCNEHHL
jgi:hypothetical protein